MSAPNPTLSNVKTYPGIAGQTCVSADVTYLDEATQRVHFIGNVYGDPGPVVMVTDRNPEGTFVTDTSRYGHKLDAQWVRKFYA